MLMLSLLVVCCKLRDEWTEAIQMVADKLQRQEEERIQCSPTSNIDNMVEEEMDISTTQHKRKVTRDNRCAHRHTNTHSLSHTLCSKYINYSSCSLSCNGLVPLTACNLKKGPLSHRFVSTWNGPLNNKGVNWFSQIKVPWQVKQSCKIPFVNVVCMKGKGYIHQVQETVWSTAWGPSTAHYTPYYKCFAGCNFAQVH